MKIEVCYALPNTQEIVSLSVDKHITVEQAIHLSGILDVFQEIDLSQQKVGIYGKIVTLQTLLNEGDRVEIYRPLTVDPNVARQRRVDKARQSGSIEGRKWRTKDRRA